MRLPGKVHRNGQNAPFCGKLHFLCYWQLSAAPDVSLYSEYPPFRWLFCNWQLLLASYGSSYERLNFNLWLNQAKRCIIYCQNFNNLGLTLLPLKFQRRIEISRHLLIRNATSSLHFSKDAHVSKPKSPKFYDVWKRARLAGVLSEKKIIPPLQH